MTSERSGDIYLALTRIVILNCCHHLLKEQISSDPDPQPGAPPRPACAVPSARPPQALEDHFFELLMLCMLHCNSGRADSKPACADPASTRVMWFVLRRHTRVLPASIHRNHIYHAHSVEQFGTAGSHETQVCFRSSEKHLKYHLRQGAPR